MHNHANERRHDSSVVSSKRLRAFLLQAVILESLADGSKLDLGDAVRGIADAWTRCIDRRADDRIEPSVTAERLHAFVARAMILESLERGGKIDLAEAMRGIRQAWGAVVGGAEARLMEGA